MSTEFHRGDVRITRYSDGHQYRYQLHNDVYTLDELKQLRSLLRAVIRNNGATNPKRRKKRVES